jgi:hypothetical protein
MAESRTVDVMMRNARDLNEQLIDVEASKYGIETKAKANRRTNDRLLNLITGYVHDEVNENALASKESEADKDSSKDSDAPKQKKGFNKSNLKMKPMKKEVSDDDQPKPKAGGFNKFGKKMKPMKKVFSKKQASKDMSKPKKFVKSQLEPKVKQKAIMAAVGVIMDAKAAQKVVANKSGNKSKSISSDYDSDD